MNCQQAKWRMSLILDSMLSADEERALQAHLIHCPICQAEWEALQSVSYFLTQAPLASPAVDLALRVEERLRRQRERRRWALGVVVVCLWLGLALAGFMSGSALLGWLLLQQPMPVGLEIQLLARLLLVGQATLRALWLLATSLPSAWLSAGINGCLIPALMLVCLWAWLALGRQRQRMLVR